MNAPSGPQTELPKPPQVVRKVRLYAFQYVGLPLLLSIPVLALLGVFGHGPVTTQQANTGLALTVEYLPRCRYKLIDTMMVSVQNQTDTALPSVLVSFSRAYVDQFSNLSFSPAAARITDQAYEVQLRDLLPAETQVVALELKCEQYGHHTGHITAEAEGMAAVSVEIQTFTFP